MPNAAPALAACPLAPAYARLTATYPDLRVTLRRPGPGDGRTTAQLCRDPLPAIAAEPVLRGQRLRADVAAGFALHRRLWPTALLFTVPWLLRREVPVLRRDQVAFDAAGNRITADPGARVIRGADEPALRAALAAHLAPLLRAFRPHLRRGPRMLWGLATDDIVEGLGYIGGLLGLEAEARSALNRLFPGATPPFTGAAGFRAGTRPARTRISCCLYYTVPGAELCTACPRKC